MQQSAGRLQQQCWTSPPAAEQQQEVQWRSASRSERRGAKLAVRI
jgi:hypothetical protein